MADVVCADCGCVIAHENDTFDSDDWHFAPCGEMICDDCCDYCFENHEPCGECNYRC